jgi:hypothetical protein
MTPMQRPAIVASALPTISPTNGLTPCANAKVPDEFASLDAELKTAAGCASERRSLSRSPG